MQQNSTIYKPENASGTTLISIIVPLFQGLRYVDKICKNIFNATRPLSRGDNVELIFVNDYPDEHIELDNPAYPFEIKIIEHSSNMGIQAARISGLKHSRGEYILFLDQDDSIDNSFFKNQLGHAGKYDVCVAMGYRVYDDGKHLIPLYSKPHTRLISRLISSKNSYIFGTDMIFSPGQCLIKRQSIPDSWINTLIANNGCDDFFLWLLMFENNCTFGFNPDACYYHIESCSNYSGEKNRMISSFSSMLDSLQQCGYPSNFLSVLNTRLYIKLHRNSPFKLAMKLLCNPKISFYTLLYKLAGYD